MNDNTRPMESAAERSRWLQRLVGPVIEGAYPAHNFDKVPQRYERRGVLIEDVRDCLADPLDPETLAANPLQRRGRFLVIGRDLGKCDRRRFYLRSFRGWRLRRPTIDDEPLRCDVVLVDGATVTEVSERQLRFDRHDAGAWIRHFNRLMRPTMGHLRAAVVQSGSFDDVVPTGGLPVGQAS